MQSAWRTVAGLASIAAALLLGLFGLSLLFSDLGPGESPESRIATIALFFAAGGFLFGFVSPTRWFLAGLIAWGAVLLGVAGLSAGLAEGSARALGNLAFFLPLLLAMGGSYIGRAVRLRWRR